LAPVGRNGHRRLRRLATGDCGSNAACATGPRNIFYGTLRTAIDRTNDLSGHVLARRSACSIRWGAASLIGSMRTRWHTHATKPVSATAWACPAKAGAYRLCIAVASGRLAKMWPASVAWTGSQAEPSVSRRPTAHSPWPQSRRYRPAKPHHGSQPPPWRGKDRAINRENVRNQGYAVTSPGSRSRYTEIAPAKRWNRSVNSSTGASNSRRRETSITSRPETVQNVGVLRSA
jgi:hypothetical protein